jgi:hypothetical protein
VENLESETSQQLARHRSPISIAFLFYLVTIGAILSACLRTLGVNEAITGRWVLMVIFVGIVIGLATGGCLGFFYFKSWTATMIATLVGTCVGAVAGAITLVQVSHYMEIILVAFVGCWLMIVVMLVAARFQSQANF